MPAPVLNGVTLPRPNAQSKSGSGVGGDVQLASGALVRYDRGKRATWAVKWNRCTDATRSLLEAAAAVRGAVTWTDPFGFTATVLVDDPQVDPIAGTDPPRFDVALKLTAVRPT